MPMRGELAASATLLGRPVLLNRATRPQFFDVLAGKDFAAVVMFAAFGLVVSLGLAPLFSRSAEFVSALAQLN